MDDFDWTNGYWNNATGDNWDLSGAQGGPALYGTSTEDVASADGASTNQTASTDPSADPVPPIPPEGATPSSQSWFDKATDFLASPKFGAITKDIGAASDAVNKTAKEQQQQSAEVMKSMQQNRVQSQVGRPMGGASSLSQLVEALMKQRSTMLQANMQMQPRAPGLSGGGLLGGR